MTTNKLPSTHRASISGGIITAPNKEKEEKLSKSKNTDKNESFPYGSCLFTSVWQGDPTHPSIKVFLVALTVTGLINLPFLPQIVQFMYGLNGDWDRKHRVFAQDSFSNVDGATHAVVVLFEKTLGLPQTIVYDFFIIAVATYAILILFDMVLGDVIGCREAWPKSWNVVNRQIYDDMFMEPARHGRLIRRLGNTLSNVLYFFLSLCLVGSIYQNHDTTDNSKHKNILAPSDGMFAVMLLFLSIFSTLWHSSNTNWIHYLDLWAMDSSIMYLIIRNICVTEYVILGKMLNLDAHTACTIAALSCFLLFTFTIARLGQFHFRCYNIRLFHGAFLPLSVRSRLKKVSNLWGWGHTDVTIGNICAYAALPILYIAVPSFLQTPMLKTVGSALAGTTACFSLSLAWSLRMFERFILDGSKPAVFFAMEQPKMSKKGRMMVVAAAIFSPTAIFHILTGVTLITGYMHSRSLEEYTVDIME